MAQDPERAKAQSQKDPKQTAKPAGRGAVSAKRAATERRTVKPTKRTTPKGGTPAATPTSGPQASSRYTPPVPLEFKTSPRWVPIVMFGLLLAGMLVVVTNYLGVLPTESGEASNWYLLAGLGLITGGFITATQYR